MTFHPRQPWLWSVKAKYQNSQISGLGRAIDIDTTLDQYMTLILDPAHDLDWDFQGQVLKLLYQNIGLSK